MADRRETLEDSPFVNRIPASIMLSLYEAPEELYVSELRHAVDTTYAHLVKQVSVLEDEYELIESDKRGRKKYVKLTSKGRNYAEKLAELVEIQKGSLTSDNPIKGK